MLNKHICFSGEEVSSCRQERSATYRIGKRRYPYYEDRGSRAPPNQSNILETRMGKTQSPTRGNEAARQKKGRSMTVSTERRSFSVSDFPKYWCEGKSDRSCFKRRRGCPSVSIKVGMVKTFAPRPRLRCGVGRVERRAATPKNSDVRTRAHVYRLSLSR